MIRVIVFLCCASLALSSPINVGPENELDAAYSDCFKKDSISCVKLKVFSFVDKFLAQKGAITVTDGVQLVKTENGEPEGAPRSLESDSFENIAIDRLRRFLNSRSLQFEIKGKDLITSVSSTSRTISETMNNLSFDVSEETEEGRGRRRRINRLLGPILAMAALKAVVLGKVAMAVIALLAGKALLVAKIALVLSMIIGLKKLLAGNQKHVTYEVVSHPQHSTHETHSDGGSYGGGPSHGGWGRSIEAQKLAYSAQIPVA